MGKYVSEKYREIQKKEWKKESGKDIIQEIILKYRTEARWQKAIIHLKERGELQDAPQDIGKLIKEVNLDVLKECKEEIMNDLFKWGWKKVNRALTAGLPEWYKEQLLEKQFEQ